jgi:hypothetical protein
VRPQLDLPDHNRNDRLTRVVRREFETCNGEGGIRTPERRNRR